MLGLFREQAGQREVIKKVNRTMGSTYSWLQNKRSPEHTIFESRGLSTKLIGKCFNRQKKSFFPQGAVNSRNLSLNDAAEADNIMKFKKNLYRLSGSCPDSEGKGSNVPSNIPDVTMEHEANGPKRFIWQGSQSVPLNSIFNCHGHRQNTGLCGMLF